MTTSARRFAVAIVLALALPRPVSAAPPCPYGPGDLPAVTLPPGTPHGAQIPIDHIVVLMQENRSFDHYFGRLHFSGQAESEAIPKGTANPNPLGGEPIKPFRQTKLCEVADLAHSWNATYAEWNGGAMDGFTAENVHPDDPTGSRAMGFYRRSDLNYYYRLYNTFAIADRYFSSVPGPTFPNRFYLVAGTSFGHIRNDIASFAQPTVFGQLDAAGVSWKIYYAQVSVNQLFTDVQAQPSKVVPIAQYFADAAAGTLPSVAFVEPTYLGDVNTENDEHPPANPQVGEAFVASIIDALLESPNWTSSAFFLLYDEHGGYFDHVPPPEACIPDAIPPMLKPGDTPGAFDRLGIRVPAAVVSPYAKRHFVSHVAYDHASVLRFIATRHDLPALTARDANADPMLDLFDFQSPPFVKPPRLPKVLQNRRQAEACAALHP